MAHRLPNLSWLRTFEAAARLRSFTAAGDELGLTQAAVSHQIRSLESKLGCALFIRRARRLELTDMGKAYLPAVKKAVEDLALSTQGLFGPRMSRAVTVKAPISTAVLSIAPRIGAFRAAHPEIGVRLLSAIWADAIADRDVDIDIRLGDGLWPGSRTELLSEERAVPICAPGTAARIQSPADLISEPLIHISGFEDHWIRFFRLTGVDHAMPEAGVSLDTSLAAVEMVAAGGGIALVMKRYADYLEQVGRTVKPVPEDMPFGQAHYLVESGDSRRPRPEVKLFKDWLQSCFADEDL